MRDIYEVPAAAILLPAHRELERLFGTIHQNQFKPRLDQQWAYLVYAGLWWEPLRTDIEAYIEHVNERVTGTIGLKLFKGHARVVTRESPNAVYDAQLATFAESGGLFSQQASPGFIEIWTLQSRMAQRVREGDDGVVSGHALQASRHAGVEGRARPSCAASTGRPTCPAPCSRARSCVAGLAWSASCWPSATPTSRSPTRGAAAAPAGPPKRLGRIAAR